MEYKNIKSIGSDCTGCRSCEQCCPKKSIVIQENIEGFLYPYVNEDTCIECGLCLKKCPQISNMPEKKYDKHFYAIKNNDNEELFKSASGGVSDIAAKVILENQGVVFGAAYTDDWTVKHILIESDNQRFRLKSSKYVQSDTDNSYSQVKQLLSEGRKVLFTGTPCQVAGLKSFLGKDDDNLFTIDLICHGVPSPLFFKKYIKYIEKKMGESLVEYNFRSKEKKGWGTQYLAKIKTKNKTKINLVALEKYGKHFMASDCYRECCYQCNYADVDRRPADITIGDFWAVNKYNPELYSEFGVSSVVVNSAHGIELLKLMKKYSKIVPITREAVIEKQWNLVHPTPRPDSRDSFYSGIHEQDFIDNLKVGLQLKQRVKSWMPKKLIQYLKKKI